MKSMGICQVSYAMKSERLLDIGSQVQEEIWVYLYLVGWIPNILQWQILVETEMVKLNYKV